MILVCGPKCLVRVISWLQEKVVKAVRERKNYSVFKFSTQIKYQKDYFTFFAFF